MDARPGGSAPGVVPAAAAARSPDPAASLVFDLAEVEARLAEIAGWPVDEQVTVFAELHGRLTAALSVAGQSDAGASVAGGSAERWSR